MPRQHSGEGSATDELRRRLPHAPGPSGIQSEARELIRWRALRDHQLAHKIEHPSPLTWFVVPEIASLIRVQGSVKEQILAAHRGAHRPSGIDRNPPLGQINP